MVEPAKTAQQSAASSSTAAGTTAAAVTVFPHSFSTALFSFLYHLASYESGGEALLSCGIMPSLLKLANWYSDEQEHITVSICLYLYVFLISQEPNHLYKCQACPLMTKNSRCLTRSLSSLCIISQEVACLYWFAFTALHHNIQKCWIAAFR